MLLHVDAILFDIDGTLVDSTAAVTRTWRTWAGAHGFDAEEILRVCHGRRSEDTIADLLPAEHRAAAVIELEQMELADLGDVIALPATQRLLPLLPAHRWAAVTSGSRRLMLARLAAAGLPTPEVLVSAEDVAVGKPDPQGYLLAAATLSLDIRRCLVVEDAPAGIRAGRAAGAQVLAVATSHPAAELSAADQVIADLTACRVESTAEGLVVRTTDQADEAHRPPTGLTAR
ncbi:HAD-IA family hydrolase [Raineyella sp. LH-20]|uniref:HAD-IA family hydrolase n=1 Tax=Raineyella sp. LH-20 TaxID=3081204 RepID=UPI002954A124|nr:HAD-IA family hydrolase [Raineyella sp. LH-20]WOP17711.1 HAD-IA family hydrolase [Raineyella sp. LH-20]